MGREVLDASTLRGCFHHVPDRFHAEEVEAGRSSCMGVIPSPQTLPSRLTRRKIAPPLISAAIVHSSTACFAHAGTGTRKRASPGKLRNPDEDRIVLIEETSEIHLEKPNLVRFEARQAQPDLPAITTRDLLKPSLRHRPDRIILGEIRGGEAFDLLQLRFPRPSHQRSVPNLSEERHVPTDVIEKTLVDQ